MSDFIAVDIDGLGDLKRKLDYYATHIQDAAVEQVGGYLLEVFKQYPPEDHSITRRQAYPETGDGFFTSRQRKWFFWALRTGRLQLPYRRTQDTRRGWRIIGKGKTLMIANEEPGAFYSMDNERQARFQRLVGWKTVGDIIRERHDKIEQQALIGIRRAQKQAGLQ